MLTHSVGWALLLLGKKFYIPAQFVSKEWVFWSLLFLQNLRCTLASHKRSLELCWEFAKTYVFDLDNQFHFIKKRCFQALGLYGKYSLSEDTEAIWWKWSFSFVLLNQVFSIILSNSYPPSWAHWSYFCPEQTKLPIVKLQLNSELHLHYKSIQLIGLHHPPTTHHITILNYKIK